MDVLELQTSRSSTRCDAVTSWLLGRAVSCRSPVTFMMSSPSFGRWYDLEFRLADLSLGTRELQGMLSPDIDATLKELEFILGSHVTREGRMVTFMPALPAPYDLPLVSCGSHSLLAVREEPGWGPTDMPPSNSSQTLAPELAAAPDAAAHVQLVAEATEDPGRFGTTPALATPSC